MKSFVTSTLFWRYNKIDISGIKLPELFEIRCWIGGVIENFADLTPIFFSLPTPPILFFHQPPHIFWGISSCIIYFLFWDITNPLPESRVLFFMGPHPPFFLVPFRPLRISNGIALTEKILSHINYSTKEWHIEESILSSLSYRCCSYHYLFMNKRSSGDSLFCKGEQL